jgi:DNA-binding response OmpR family regulator
MARILVIDDSRTIRAMARQTLEREGYQVLLAENGRIGIDIHRHEPCDLVITDLIMPEKEGLETIRELRRSDPGIKIIAMSGGTANLDKRELLQAAVVFGASRGIAKPFHPRDLVDGVRELVGLAGSDPSSSAMPNS